MGKLKFSIGVDVGTNSVRVGLVCVENGKLYASHVEDIDVYEVEGKDDHYEQSSTQIWSGVCKCIHQAVDAVESNEEVADFTKSDILGIGFDATCSLVALDEKGEPVTVSLTGESDRNIIVWMDHRAEAEAAFINTLNHEVLKYVGGTISPEMETPKLLWLKKNLPETWEKAHKYMDLADFLTYRATGLESRSLCTVGCKWTFQNHLLADKREQTCGDEGWNDTYWNEIGLSDIVDGKYVKIGTEMKPVGYGLGNLSEAASNQLGLSVETKVVTSIIDAHAGGIGILGASVEGEEVTEETLEHRIAMIAGTSTCHMGVSRAPNFIHGIWGPYYSAMVPGMWLTEGGQSISGALLDFILNRHPEHDAVEKEAESKGKNVFELLNEKIIDLATGRGLSYFGLLTEDFHMLDYLHGNRSPRADPTLKGVVVGYTLSSGINSLLLEYLAALQALGFGTRHILAEMNANGYSIDKIFVTGGLSQNSLFLRTHADITQCAIFVPQEPQSVLVGASILGAVAGGAYSSVLGAMSRMCQVGDRVNPNEDVGVVRFLDKKYAVYQKLYEDFTSYRKIMTT